MTSKERAALKTQAMQLDSIFQIGKSSLTPQMVEAIRDALKARELIKVSILKNCLDDPKEIAQVLSERTGSEIVQVIGKKIVLYKKSHVLEEKRKRIAGRAAVKGTDKRRNNRTAAKGTDRHRTDRTAVKGTDKRRTDRTAVKGTDRRRTDRTAAKGTDRHRTGKTSVKKGAAGRNTKRQMKWSDW